MGKVFDVMKNSGEERPLDIHDLMVKHPSSTFFMKMESDGPEGTDIKAGDTLVVDRSLSPKRGSILVVAEDGELKVQRHSVGSNLEEDVTLWGVITGLLRHLC